MKKKVAVWYWPGTNCEEESMAAFNSLGAHAYLVFIKDLVEKRVSPTDADIIFWPGGFSFGDNIDTGIIAAIMVEDILPPIVEARIPLILVCNGFQIAMRSGMFFDRNITLTQNACGVFRSWPVKHRVVASNCLWTDGLEGEILRFPSAHHGGKLVGEGNINVVMTYASDSPNGGPVAAITNEDGTIIGIMDHPERPFGNEDGRKIFRNGLKAV